MQSITRNLIKMHWVVFIYGFTAILGKLITLDATELVWHRMFIAFISLGVLLKLRKRPLGLPLRAAAKMIGVGFVVALHWIAFFHAIKISTISVVLGCMASTTLFTSLLEPALIKRPIVFLEVMVGLLIILGLYIIFQFEPDHMAGIITALTAAFLAALFTVMNKGLIESHRPLVISFYEMGGGFLAISLYLFFTGTFGKGLQMPVLNDWFLLLILGIVCTAYAFATSVQVMKVLSAYTAVLIINLEPVYGILLAFLFFGDSEYMSAGFYAGTLIILTAVILFPILSKKLSLKKPPPPLPIK